MDGSIASGGRSAHDLTPLVRRGAWGVGRQAWSMGREQSQVVSGRSLVNAKRGDRATGEKRQNKANLLVVSVMLIIGML